MTAALVAITRLSGLFPLALVVPAAEGVHALRPRRGASASGTSRSTYRSTPGRAAVSGVWLASYLVLWLVVFVLAFLLAGIAPPARPAPAAPRR